MHVLKSRVLVGEEEYRCEVKIIQDSAISSFDRVVGVDFEVEDDERDFAEELKQEVLEGIGMFCDDVLALGVRYEDKRSYKALRKCVLKFFKSTNQVKRYNQAVSEVICRCKGVTDLEIRKFISVGKKFEDLKFETGATMGCGSCRCEIEGMFGLGESVEKGVEAE